MFENQTLDIKRKAKIEKRDTSNWEMKFPGEFNRTGVLDMNDSLRTRRLCT